MANHGHANSPFFHTHVFSHHLSPYQLMVKMESPEIPLEEKMACRYLASLPTIPSTTDPPKKAPTLSVTHTGISNPSAPPLAPAASYNIIPTSPTPTSKSPVLLPSSPPPLSLPLLHNSHKQKDPNSYLPLSFSFDISSTMASMAPLFQTRPAQYLGAASGRHETA